MVKQKFVAEDGTEFDNAFEAEKHERNLRMARFQFGEDGVKRLAKRGQLTLTNRRWAKYPSLLVVKEKHEYRYFHITSADDICKVSMKILRQRVADDYWYYDEDKVIAEAIVAADNTFAAFAFLYQRAGHQYEGFETTWYESIE